LVSLDSIKFASKWVVLPTTRSRAAVDHFTDQGTKKNSRQHKGHKIKDDEEKIVKINF